MSAPQIYRKTPVTAIRETKSLTATEQTQISNKIASFFTYFKAKHT
tara:strand:- start:1899 stop:2036 length:138 start_codon:yes stop_codon:yes gene_type:complete